MRAFYAVREAFLRFTEEEAGMRTLEQVEADITATEAQLARLHAERREIRAAARVAELRRKLADLPPEVRAMLRAETPPQDGYRRLSARGLARRSDGRYYHVWTDLGQEMRALLAEEGA